MNLHLVMSLVATPFTAVGVLFNFSHSCQHLTFILTIAELKIITKTEFGHSVSHL